MRKLLGALLGALFVSAALIGSAAAQTYPGGGGSSGSSGITANSTATSGCGANGVLFSGSSKVQCDTGFTYAGAGGTVLAPAGSACTAGNVGLAVGVNTYGFYQGTNTFGVCVNGALAMDDNITTGGSWSFTGNVKTSSSFIAAQDVQVGNTRTFFWGTRSQFASPADGNILLWNAAATSFGLLQWGGVTSSFPAIKRSGAGLQVRLADDSADAALEASSYNVGGTAGASCTLTTIAHLTVVNGIVTLCN